MSTPVPLYRYQKHWLEDDSQLKAGLWCRSSGKTFVETLEIALDCKRADVEGRRVNWFMWGGAWGQTFEMIEYAALHAKVLELALEQTEEREVVDGVELTKRVITFEKGSRIVGLPTNKLSIRGKHGSIWWDEAGHTPHDEDIWGAAAPIAGRKGFKLRLTGTPGPKRGPFYRVMTGEMPGWSRTKIDVYQAIKDGAPLDIEKIRSLTRGPKFVTEYLCEFEDEGIRFIPLELITVCEDDQTLLVPLLRIDGERRSSWEPHLTRQSENAPSEGYDSVEAWQKLFAPLRGRKNLFLGFDVARTGHLSVLWVTEIEGLLRRARAIIAFSGRRFAEQEAALWAAMEHCQRGCIDATGLGTQIAERTVEKFGELRAEAVVFNTSVKEDLAARMLRLYEDRLSRIPPSEAVRESIHSVYKTTTAAGHTRFDADATEEAGHADYFWGQALSALAAGDGTVADINLLQPGGMQLRWSRRGGMFA